MISVFILPLNHFWNWDAQREELTNVQREKERERTTHIRVKGERSAVDRDLAFTPIAISRSTAPIAIARSVDHNLAKHHAGRDRGKRRSRSWSQSTALIAILPSPTLRAIAISRSTVPIAISPSCRSQPLVEPNCLSLFLLLSIWPNLMIFFSGFCLCFCIEEWMILYIYLATEKMWENVTGFDDFFFWVLFMFLYWGMNDIIYSFGNRENVSNK